MQVKITPFFVTFLVASSALSQTSEASSNSTEGLMMSLLVSPAGPFLAQLPMDDAQLVSKADAVSAINQSLTPVGTFPTTLQPALPVNKLVFAHFIVGNTYNYSTTNWKADIILASSKGIDAFALNVGSDSWEPSQVANAFFAASALKTSFKLFLSFDMGSLPCARATDADLLKTYISTYKTHPNQQLIDGKVLVSTFSGSDCKFEQNTVDNGWKYAIKSGANANGTYFVPAWFIDPATFSQYTVLDGAFGWNSGWPMGDYDIDFSQDQAYINNLPSRSYMAAVSPWFYTHYQSKNFIYRSDDWLLAKRWEDLITHRSSVNFVEVNTWNDYGESHYVGPIEGIQPNSQAWVDGYDHTAWLDLIKYYISAFKTGTYPTISTDRTFVWGRTYKANAVATNDPLPKPDHYTWTDDYIYAVILLRTPATFTLSCGSLTTTSAAPAGLSKFKLGPLIQSCTVSSKITRGRTVVNNTYQSKFKFTTANPSVYNYNAYVAST